MLDRRRGFTLIELMLVFVILSIVTAVVALRLQGPMRHARMREVTGQIASFDRLTRLYATEQDRPLKVVVNMDAGEFRRTDPKGEEELGSVLRLPAEFAVEKVIVAGKDPATRGEEVAFSRLGATRSYAVRLAGPGGDTRWLIFTGLGGEWVEGGNEEQVREILERTFPGHHAD